MVCIFYKFYRISLGVIMNTFLNFFKRGWVKTFFKYWVQPWHPKGSIR
jgi:hypothetical protein